MKMVSIVLCLYLFLSCPSVAEEKLRKILKPNIVVIYADDLGYADLSCYGAIGVKTPNIDKLAREGVRFTDSHCSAATCTPSRYSLLTGSYAFRSNAEILPGTAPLLIRPEKPTLPGMLKKNGYKSAIVGKWHLGLGDGQINWNEEIKPGPLEVGFDYSFILPATADRVPCVFVENHRVVNLDNEDPIIVNYDKKVGNLPTGLSNREMLKMQADTQHSATIINGISRIGYMDGGKKAWWVDETFAEIFTAKAANFIESNKKQPFFLYLALSDIHVPRVPNERFVGKSSMGPRGDVIVQLDWCVGQVIEKLKELGLERNTLVILSSDNGPILDDGYSDQAVEKAGKHNPAGPFRGGKYSIYEAGTRMPTIVFWPGNVQSSVSNALWSQVDLYASLASLVGHTLGAEEAPDSRNVLNAILGRSKVGRQTMLEEAFTLGVRDGNWKYIAPFSGKIPGWMKNKNVETGLGEEQLYDLGNDINERNNLIKTNKDQGDKLRKELSKILKSEMTR
jgi:arylsulfatase A-like enzyme